MYRQTLPCNLSTSCRTAQGREGRKEWGGKSRFLSVGRVMCLSPDPHMRTLYGSFYRSNFSDFQRESSSRGLDAQTLHDAISSVCSLAASLSSVSAPCVTRITLLESPLSYTQASKYSAAALAQARAEERARFVSVTPPSARGGDESQRLHNSAQLLGTVCLPTPNSSGAGPEPYDARPSLRKKLQLLATRLKSQRFGSPSACF